jgi:hypothetical protein
MENATAKNEIEDWMLVFAKVEPQIKRALKYSGGTHTSEDIFIGIAEGYFQLWATNGTVGITEIVESPRVKTLNIFLAAGRMEDAKATLPKIEEYARQVGCSRITLLGRKGWAKSFLKDEGFEPKAELLAKDI